MASKMRDDDFNNFQAKVVDKVVANATPWNIPAGKVTALTTRQAEYEPLYQKAQEKKDRTSGDVDSHRQSRKAYEAELRVFINSYIRYNDDVPREDKIEMGIPPRDVEPTPRPTISTVPIIGFKTLRGGELEVACKVQSDQTRSSMHPSADAVEVRYSLVPAGELPPEKAAQCSGTHVSKKAKFKIRLGEENAGKRFYGFFRWVNISRPDNNGPWSDPQPVMIS